jgi:hypothetical protein
MQGPHRLNPSEIDRVVPGSHPGNFAIGYVKDAAKRTFVVRYIGRADNDLNRTLKEQEADESSWFKWSYAPSEKAAFDKECKNFHDFGEHGQLENDYHPEPPEGTKWKCPVCE